MCGQSLGIPGLKWLKQLCFHMEENSHTREGKATLKQILLGSFTKLIEKEEDPQIFSIFLSKEAAGEGVDSTSESAK